jgi:hypothetical protein
MDLFGTYYTAMKLKLNIPQHCITPQGCRYKDNNGIAEQHLEGSYQPLLNLEMFILNFQGAPCTLISRVRLRLYFRTSISVVLMETNDSLQHVFGVIS